jgi:hypothetical protein
MVQQGGDPYILVLRCLPYAVQPVGHAFPARSPVHAVLNHISLGPFSWLHRLRRRLSAFVRRLPPVSAAGIQPDRYYGRV